MKPSSIRRWLSVAGLAMALCATPVAQARKGGHGGGQHSGSHAGASHSGAKSGAKTGGGAKPTKPTKAAKAPKQNSHAPGQAGPKPAADVSRDAHGKIKRSAGAKNEFKHEHPCPSTGKAGGACPGYVVDHVKPLKRGGADAPGNMQWQTKDSAKRKIGRAHV